MKSITLSQAETKQRQAVAFLQRTGKEELADEFDNMSVEDYAEHRGLEILDNPQRRTNNMARITKSKDELLAELDEANDYINKLEGKSDDITGIASDEEEDEEEGEEDEEEDSADDEDE